MKKKTLCFLSFPFVILAAVLLISCGGSGDSSGISGVSSGSAVLYATDSPEDDYKQVTMTLNLVQLVHTEKGNTCTLLDTSKTMDITDLSSKLQLLNIVDCDALNYNRVHIEFAKNIRFTDISNAMADCNFASYKDNENKPNVLKCEGDTCSMDINGAVNVLAGKNNNVALDFELKEFEVEYFPQAECSVTMKVSPLNASGIKKKHDDGYEEGISGKVKSIDTSLQNFVMTTESGSYTVSYAGITQQGIEDILNLALNDELEVNVESAAIDPDSKEIDASSVYIEVEGTLSNFAPDNEMFTLTYQADKTIPVYYHGAEIEGILAEESLVEVKLEGYDGSQYLAREVEVDD